MGCGRRIMKYVIFNDIQFVIFPNSVSHDTFKNLKPTSAGFLSFHETEDEFGDKVTKVFCRGDSYSLDLDSRCEEDDKIINRGLRG